MSGPDILARSLFVAPLLTALMVSVTACDRPEPVQRNATSADSAAKTKPEAAKMREQLSELAAASDPEIKLAVETFLDKASGGEVEDLYSGASKIPLVQRGATPQGQRPSCRPSLCTIQIVCPPEPTPPIDDNPSIGLRLCKFHRKDCEEDIPCDE